MKNKERIIWIFIVCILLTISIGYVIKNNSNQERMFADIFYIRKLKYDINILKKELEDSDIKPRIVNEPELSKLKIASLKDLGLNDPENDIKSDLFRHMELIPYDGVLGGTMGFYEKNMRILNNRVLANFEDGHIGGYMLLEYDVEPKGQINWKVLYAYSDYYDGDY